MTETVNDQRLKVATATHGYEKNQDDEIGFDTGEQIQVLEEYKDQWCKGLKFSDRKLGVFPSTHVEFVENVQPKFLYGKTIITQSSDDPDRLSFQANDIVEILGPASQLNFLTGVVLSNNKRGLFCINDVQYLTNEEADAQIARNKEAEESPPSDAQRGIRSRFEAVAAFQTNRGAYAKGFGDHNANLTPLSENKEFGENRYNGFDNNFSKNNSDLPHNGFNDKPTSMNNGETFGNHRGAQTSQMNHNGFDQSSNNRGFHGQSTPKENANLTPLSENQRFGGNRGFNPSTISGFGKAHNGFDTKPSSMNNGEAFGNQRDTQPPQKLYNAFDQSSNNRDFRGQSTPNENANSTPLSENQRFGGDRGNGFISSGDKGFGNAHNGFGGNRGNGRNSSADKGFGFGGNDGFGNKPSSMNNGETFGNNGNRGFNPPTVSGFGKAHNGFDTKPSSVNNGETFGNRDSRGQSVPNENANLTPLSENQRFGENRGNGFNSDVKGFGKMHNGFDGKRGNGFNSSVDKGNDGFGNKPSVNNGETFGNNGNRGFNPTTVSGFGKAHNGFDTKPSSMNNGEAFGNNRGGSGPCSTQRDTQPPQKLHNAFDQPSNNRDSRDQSVPNENANLTPLFENQRFGENRGNGFNSSGGKSFGGDNGLGNNGLPPNPFLTNKPSMNNGETFGGNAQRDGQTSQKLYNAFDQSTPNENGNSTPVSENQGFGGNPSTVTGFGKLHNGFDGNRGNGFNSSADKGFGFGGNNGFGNKLSSMNDGGSSRGFGDSKLENKFDAKPPTENAMADAANNTDSSGNSAGDDVKHGNEKPTDARKESFSTESESQVTEVDSIVEPSYDAPEVEVPKVSDASSTALPPPLPDTPKVVDPDITAEDDADIEMADDSIDEYPGMDDFMNDIKNRLEAHPELRSLKIVFNGDRKNSGQVSVRTHTFRKYVHIS